MALNCFIKQGSKIWIHHSGRTFLFDTEAIQQKKYNTQKNSSQGSLESPMPGKVLKMNVNKAERVKENQTLCIIEAMKMEYALKAPYDGIVKNILKTDGQQVQLGEKILELEKV